jgi:SPASM domain peptide maturase of grasp-with-spasm system
MKYLKIFEDCRFVRGHKRSIIYDLGNEKYHFIPNILCEIANKFDGKSIDELYNYYGIYNSKYIDEYLTYLTTNYFAIICNKKQCEIFQQLNLVWNNPSKVTNAIIEINDKFDFSSIFNQLENLGCYHIQLRAANIIDPEVISNILSKTKNSAIKTIELVLKHHDNIESYKTLIDKCYRLNSIVFHSSPQDIKYKETIHFALIRKNLNSAKDYIVIDPAFFNVNMPLFTESLEYNSYLNRKISIDYSGNLKNCTNAKQIFGNIKHDEISKVIDNKSFTKYWRISKDKIQVCKDCEYRYMCIDARIPHRNMGHDWFFDTECAYNPYTAKWNNE